MKWLFLLLTVIVLLDVSFAGKRKKVHKHFKEQALLDEDKELDELAGSQEEVQEDPCLKKHCGAGQICKLDDLGEPFCTCVEECPEETEPRRKVCSNFNSTWGSDCELYRMRCWCKKSMKGCENIPKETREKYEHMHIDYFGECKEMEECDDGQMADFPRRMRDWLFNIMRDMAEREELSPHYLKLEREAEGNLTKRWANAAVWKFCDLDASQDRTVSRHELFPIRAPLMALEHCIAPFLNKCDANNDHMISFQEWVSCLELEEDSVEVLCDDIRDKH